jgi:hypothetical protein
MVEAERTSREMQEEPRATQPEGQGASAVPTSGGELDLESDEVRHNQIAARAYQHWQARGEVDGASEEDWYLAEQELRLEEELTHNQARSAASAH